MTHICKDAFEVLREWAFDKNVIYSISHAPDNFWTVTISPNKLFTISTDSQDLLTAVESAICEFEKKCDIIK